MHMPIHAAGVTLFPRTGTLGKCWIPVVHIVRNAQTVDSVRCFGLFIREADALCAAREDALDMAGVYRKRGANSGGT